MMNFESIDRTNEPGASATEEFEKLEFLPEQPADDAPLPDDTAEIIFTPEADAEIEPPVSFNPADDDGNDLSFEPEPAPDLAASLPFELLGSSLFDDGDLDDFDPLDGDDFDDDLEF